MNSCPARLYSQEHGCIIARSYETVSFIHNRPNGTDNHRKIIFRYWHIEFELVKNISFFREREKKNYQLIVQCE